MQPPGGQLWRAAAESVMLSLLPECDANQGAVAVVSWFRVIEHLGGRMVHRVICVGYKERMFSANFLSLLLAVHLVIVSASVRSDTLLRQRSCVCVSL